MSADILVRDRSQQIADIINQRQGMIRNIATAEENIKNLLSAIRKVEEKRQEIIPQIGETGASCILETSDFNNFIESLQTEYDKLQNLKIRFSNSTLNIGVVGKMKQGKSTLLRSFTGLIDEIPAREGKPCTAARSTICHQAEGKTKATVTFHTEDSFLKEVIHPYFDELNLTSKPKTIDDFAGYSFTKYNNLPQGATHKTMYDRLYNDYFLGLGGYKNLLNKPPLENVVREKIPKYVAQERDANDRLTDYEHLAVRHVKIFCTFPKADIGQIALVDVPGMGDFKLGDEKLMLETLGKEVDVVLFVCKPGNDGYGWQTEDTNLYDKATTALNDLADRAFMVLNLHSTGDNRNGCDSQKADVDNNISVRMEFAKPCIIANCANGDPNDSDNANNKVLEPVLKYLQTEITKLDKKYAHTCQQRILELHEQVKAELNKASDILQQFADEDKQFNEYFVGSPDRRGGLWNKLTDSLGKLRFQIREKREEEDKEFKERVIKTIKDCKEDTGIPSPQEIETQAHTLGGLESRYPEYLDELRAHISRHFLSLDCDLQQSLEVVKSEVKKVLAKDGRLGNLSNSEGSRFFMEIAAQLPDGKESCLKLGFKTIGEFNISFAGRIQRLIRPHLEPLDHRINRMKTTVISPTIKETVKTGIQVLSKLEPVTGIAMPVTGVEELLTNMQDINTPNIATPANTFDAQEIHSRLKKIHDQVVTACENELEKLYSDPNQVAYYMVEDFLDRVLYEKGIQSEWEYFFRKNRQQVWHEFKLLAERIKVKQEWESLINQAKSTNELYLLRFVD